MESGFVTGFAGAEYQRGRELANLRVGQSHRCQRWHHPTREVLLVVEADDREIVWNVKSQAKCGQNDADGEPVGGTHDRGRSIFAFEHRDRGVVPVVDVPANLLNPWLAAHGLSPGTVAEDLSVRLYEAVSTLFDSRLWTRR